MGRRAFLFFLFVAPFIRIINAINRWRMSRWRVTTTWNCDVVDPNLDAELERHFFG